MRTITYLYKVTFNKAPAGHDGKRDFFFGSLAAIYTLFSADDIGCKVERLWNLKITPEKPYFGRRCTITKDPFYRKKQKRQNHE